MSGSAVTFAERLRRQFDRREHLYGVLLDDMARDHELGGISRELFGAWSEADPRQVPQLRLLAGLFRIVLRGDAPQLVPYYPVLGGHLDPADAWEVVRPVLVEHAEELRAALDIAPQTNEPGRGVALLLGLTEAVRRTGLHRIRLLEPGASAGLGLLVDRYRLEGDGWRSGPADSPVVITGCGAGGWHPEAYEIVSRRGCDLSPVDLSTEGGPARLRSFVWPWMLDRHARLEGAIALAREHPVLVDRAPAGEWLRRQLSGAAPDGVLTVVWHSVTRMYWPEEERAQVDQLVEEARSRMPVAHVAIEHPWTPGGVVTAQDDELVPCVELDGEVIATCGHHGPPVRWCA